jgi:hypothetical protein
MLLVTQSEMVWQAEAVKAQTIQAATGWSGKNLATVKWVSGQTKA